MSEYKSQLQIDFCYMYLYVWSKANILSRNILVYYPKTTCKTSFFVVHEDSGAIKCIFEKNTYALIRHKDTKYIENKLKQLNGIRFQRKMTAMNVRVMIEA